MRKILLCYGTRPEFIKIAPVVEAFYKYPELKVSVICSGQHEELLRGLSQNFGVSNHYDLKVRSRIGKSSDLNLLAANLIVAFSKKFDELKPSGIVVQGDAASAFCAALSAFHKGIPIFYIEAGLRTYDVLAPFPEEGYRQMLSRLASLCFAPTKVNLKNLMGENIAKSKIHVVGNTVIDALNIMTKDLMPFDLIRLLEKRVPQFRKRGTRKLVVVELHRREIYGKLLVQVLNTLCEIQERNPDYFFVFPAHPSPFIKPIVSKTLEGHEGFAIITPPDYRTFIALLKISALVISDSGGLQEEMPTLGKPVMVIREKTERVEGLARGWSKLAGFERDKILSTFESLKNWQKPAGKNPYGDGNAAVRIAKYINDFF